MIMNFPASVLLTPALAVSYIETVWAISALPLLFYCTTVLCFFLKGHEQTLGKKQREAPSNRSMNCSKAAAPLRIYFTVHDDFWKLISRNLCMIWKQVGRSYCLLTQYSFIILGSSPIKHVGVESSLRTVSSLFPGNHKSPLSFQEGMFPFGWNC